MLVLYAVQMAPLSHVAPAREVSMLFAALIGGRLLGEATGRRAWPAPPASPAASPRSPSADRAMLLAGVDFSCNPSRRKPITVATGRLDAARLLLDDVAELTTLAAFESWLRTPGPWLGGFDFPFGLPRAFVDAHAFGTSAAEVIASVQGRCPTRMAWRAFIDAWGNSQPAGARLLHRRTDAASAVTSTSPMQTRYVPVGLMYYEGVGRLIDSGVTLPGLHHGGDPERVALEAYPRRLAHALVARRSYKNSDDERRRATREAIVAGLEGASTVRLRAPCRRVRASLVGDASGDRLDAVLCLVQAAIASRRIATACRRRRSGRRLDRRRLKPRAKRLATGGAVAAGC